MTSCIKFPFRIGVLSFYNTTKFHKNLPKPNFGRAMPDKSAFSGEGDAERKPLRDLSFVCGSVSFLAVIRAKRQQENQWATLKFHHGRSHK